MMEKQVDNSMVFLDKQEKLGKLNVIGESFVLNDE